ncbi:uncharacterized protein ARMOST_20867 [Armillaria ostoyae]|uniref:Heterokaryon incompatibility domain-containing protein n=1 Tax=Armillaria ostoyae TaxID=47428 RepID=A0A284S8K7_ARMOS|nr:uncharacterized protein ARMOST_20867 [Armillaria ostoyae]
MKPFAVQVLLKYAKFPKVTISARTGITKSEEEIAVPSQRNYTGAKPVISASLANTPCTTFGLRGLLDRLNDTLGTSYTLDITTRSSLLEDCIANEYDFGIAYGSLHGAWYTDNWSLIPFRLRESSNIPSASAEYSDAISHAWVDEKERMDVWTPINGRQWPVSIPKDADLNMGLEYVWLDVLCLSQRGGLREDLRVEEWMLDVPTTGQVYRVVKVYCYLSGLGRPLTVTQDYFYSDRRWFNRAWTLQEVAHQNHVICGVTPDGPLDAKPYKDGSYANESLKRFYQKLRCLRQAFHEIFEVLEEMRRRASTNSVHKIAGIAFLLGPCTIPAYYETQSIEEPGNAGTIWRPSWDQLMEKPLPEYHTPADNSYYTRIERDTENNIDRCEEALCIENGFVRGLAVVGVPGTYRHGELLIEEPSGIQHSFRITAIHQYHIPDGTYTLIGSQESRYDSQRQWVQWVVGRSRTKTVRRKLREIVSV